MVLDGAIKGAGIFPVATVLVVDSKVIALIISLVVVLFAEETSELALCCMLVMLDALQVDEEVNNTGTGDTALNSVKDEEVIAISEESDTGVDCVLLLSFMQENPDELKQYATKVITNTAKMVETTDTKMVGQEQTCLVVEGLRRSSISTSWSSNFDAPKFVKGMVPDLSL